MNKEMEFKNIVAQYSKVASEEMNNEMRLDVYKRQVKNCFRIGGDEFAYVYHSDEKDMIPERLKTLEPVSYTHLDVYKRQAIYE